MPFTVLLTSPISPCGMASGNCSVNTTVAIRCFSTCPVTPVKQRTLPGSSRRSWPACQDSCSPGTSPCRPITVPASGFKAIAHQQRRTVDNRPSSTPIVQQGTAHPYPGLQARHRSPSIPWAPGVVKSSYRYGRLFQQAVKRLGSRSRATKITQTVLSFVGSSQAA